MNAGWLRSRTLVRAVDEVTLEICPRESVGLVGESGCGKTTTAKMILLLERPTSGLIRFRGQDVNSLRGQELREYRAAVQAVFQDPWASLNPRMRAGSIISEPLEINTRMRRAEVRQWVAELLVRVGLEPAAANRFPHELSGGMRQRAAIARALALRPSLIVLDEPVSMLDVSIRAQIMNLLKELQEQFGTSYLLVAHNLATVRYLCHRVVVMHLGEVVEQASSEELFSHPLHPYTNALISAAMPTRPGEEHKKIVLEGEVPSPMNPPPGCRFHTRCPFAFDRCRVEAPQLRELRTGHFVACHLHQ